MPETARLLRFPVPAGTPLTQEESLEKANAYLQRARIKASDVERNDLLETPDVLLSVCMVLRERVDAAAEEVCKESIAIYKCIIGSSACLATFDERDYFLGESALIAATASRVLGKRSESELWLDRAEAGFRQTVNPTPLLANVTYQRLALRCEVGQYDEVSELAPMLAASFSKQGMLREEAKCVLLEGIALKQNGQTDAALLRFQSLANAQLEDRDPGLVGLALVNAADVHVACGREEMAAKAYSQALPLVERAGKPAARAHLKGTIGETLYRQGRLAASMEAYLAAIEDYQALGMATWVAYLRVVLAHAMLEAGKPREAEWQILAALPTLDEQRMVPEGFAAVALLRESVRQRKTDPKALLELRDHLKAQN